MFLYIFVFVQTPVVLLCGFLLPPNSHQVLSLIEKLLGDVIVLGEGKVEAESQ